MAVPLILEDHYSTLLIPQSASIESIRESYKKLALKYHPDKNSSPNATRQFQCLVRAWECLRDEKKRAEYDANYWVVKIGLGVGVNVGSAAGASGTGGGKRGRGWEGRFGEEATKWDGWGGGEGERTRRKREDDREARSSFNDAKEKVSKANQERKSKARAWKIMARQDYISRLSTWQEKNTKNTLILSQSQKALQKLTLDLKAQTRETDAKITKRFYSAAQKSRELGASIQNEHLILKKLLQGRKAYTSKLEAAISATKARCAEISAVIQQDWTCYEYEEAKARQSRIREALSILGPRDQKSPVFSMISRRGQTINLWKSLSRVKAASFSSLSPSPSLINQLQCKDNAKPWHEEGPWEKIVGEQTCGRCHETSFQIIEECAAALCPGCGIIACFPCWRDLMLLKEYGAWLCEEEGMRGSLFEIEFEG